MNTKSTAEGHIFHCEGEREVAMVHELLAGDGGSSLGTSLLDRLRVGGGAFCVFHSETAEFCFLMSKLEHAAAGGKGNLEEMLRGVAREMKEAVSSPRA